MKTSLEAGLAGVLVGHQLAVFTTLAILVLVVLLAMALILRRARRRGDTELAAAAMAAPIVPQDASNEAPPPLPASATPWHMWRAFRLGLRAYRRHVGSLNGVYTAPWILMLGREGAGKTALLDGLEPNEAPTTLSDPQTKSAIGCAWWLYDEAVVIEVPGHVTRPQGRLADGAWRMLLRLLRWHRPRRPIDAIVVVMPVTDFWGPARLDQPAMRRQAQAVQARLFQAQSALGFCLPVHVVLTHGDTLPGFAQFADALPEQMRNGVFGWSNPHALDAAYAPTWLAAGFEELRASLLQIQLELHASGTNATPPEILFQLASEVRSLREPLELFLSGVFRRTVFQEALFFRGFYLTAAGLDAFSAPHEGGQDSRIAQRAIFTGALFRQKIFVERDLSRPTSAFALGAGRRRRVAQAFAVLVGFLLLAGIGREGDRAGAWRDSMVPTLRRLSAPEGAPEARVEQFASEIAALEPPFHSLLLPASWLDGSNERVKAALALDYDRTILGASRERLEAGLQRLVRPTGTQSLAEDVPSENELDRLRDYVEQVTALEAGVARYNALAGLAKEPSVAGKVKVADGAEVSDLLSGIWGITVPAGFVDSMSAWQITARSDTGLASVPPLSLAGYHAAAIARLEQLAEAACDRLASGGPALQMLARVAADLAGAVQPNSKVEQVLGFFADARDRLREAAPEVGADPDSWAGASSFGFTPGVQVILDGIAKSVLLGTGERDRVIAQARRHFAASDEGTRLAQSLVGPLLTRDPAGGIVLSPTATKLESALQAWLERPFLRITGASAPRNDSPGWNPQMLSPAAPLAEDYLSFETKDVGSFSMVLQPVIRSVSRLRLQQNLLDIVFRANGPGLSADPTEAVLRDQVMRLAAAAPRLVDVLHMLGQIDATGAEAQLRDMVRQQARLLLNGVDRLLAQDALYQPSQAALQASAEQPLPNYLLFGLPDAATLEQNLALAHQRVSNLAHGLVSPLLGVLALPEFAGPGLLQPGLLQPGLLQPGLLQQGGDQARWAATIAELDKFESQRPGNAVAALQTFILIDLADPAGACVKAALPDLAGYGSDLFSLRRRQLRAGLAAHCAHVDGARLASGYAAISDGFDRLLAGRYPFARPGAPDVGAYALLSFYDLFDRNLPSLAAASASPEMSARPGDGVASFIAALQAARPLVAPVSATGEEVSLQVDIQFRTNRAAEQGGDQIIEWRLSTGQMSTSSLEPRKRITWHPGDPVQLSLRWAKDGHVVPTASGNGLGHQEGNTLTFGFSGGWALLSMLQQLRGDPTLNGSGVGTLIALPFRTREVPSQANLVHPEAKSQDSVVQETAGRVFATITLRRLGTFSDNKAASEQGLVMPRFPVEAPLLDVSSNVPAPALRGVIVPRLVGPKSLASE
jgi:type VI secretion system protein ImpL